MGTVVSKSEVLFNGTYYPTVGPIQPFLATQPPQKTVTGDAGPDDEPLLSNWVVDDNRGGVGVDLIDSANPQHQGRFRWSTAWTGHRKQLALPPLVRTTSWTLANPRTPTLGAEYNGKLWFAAGNALYKWDDFTSTTSGVTTLAAPTDMVSFRNSSSVDILVYCTGVSTGWWKDSTGAGGEDLTYPGTYLTVWDNKVWKINSTGQLAYTTTPDTLSSWTNTGSPLPSTCTGLLVAPQPSTKEAGIWAATTDGFWLWNGTSNKWEQSGFVVPSRPLGGYGSTVWRSMLYYNPGNLSVYQFNTTENLTPVVTAIGMDLDDGLPADMQGRIRRLAPSHNWLLAIVDVGVTGSDVLTGDEPTTTTEFPVYKGYTAIMAFNGAGWHCLYRSAVGEYVSSLLTVSSAYNDYRVWFGTNRALKYIRLDPAYLPPRGATTKEYDSTGTYISSALGLTNAKTQLGVTLRVRTENCTSTETVAVYVDYDLADSWTLLGTITTNGRTTYPLETSANARDGRGYEFIRVKLVLSRGSDSTKSPIVTYVVHPHAKLLDRLLGFSFTVDCSKSFRENTAHHLRDLLFDTMLGYKLVQLTYQDDSDNRHTYQVLPIEITGAEVGGTLDWGQFLVKAVMVSSDQQIAGTWD